MAKIWDNNKQVAEISISDKTKLTVSACARDGKKYINMHEFYCTKNDPTWKPGRSGICLKAEVLAELIAVLNVASTVVEELPLSDENNAVYAVDKEKK